MKHASSTLKFTALPVPRNQLGESPFWHPQEKRLYWCDIKAHRVHAFHPATQAYSSWSFDAEPGCIAPASLAHHIVVALRSSIELLNTQTGKREVIATLPHNAKEFRSNDGKCDAQGRFWIGTVFEPKTAEAAALWMLQAREGAYHLEQKLTGNITSNGLAFSANSERMYWAHTAAHRVDVMDFDLHSAAITHRRAWLQFADKAVQPYGGRPDGAAVDSEGCYWTAMYEGGALLRISAQGQVIAKYEVPTRYPTMPCFGGEDLRTLYLTSASSTSSSAEENSQDGLIFSARVEVAGLSVASFRLATA